MSKEDFNASEVASVAENRWKGRERRGYGISNSFKHFVDIAKKSKTGQEHLKRHHRGYGL